MIAVVILCKELTKNHDIEFYKSLKKKCFNYWWNRLSINYSHRIR